MNATELGTSARSAQQRPLRSGRRMTTDHWGKQLLKSNSHPGLAWR